MNIHADAREGSCQSSLCSGRETFQHEGSVQLQQAEQGLRTRCASTCSLPGIFTFPLGEA